MAKVITFSRVFPAYHPRAGQPTYFVEQIYNCQNAVIDNVEFIATVERQDLEQLNPEIKYTSLIGDFLSSLRNRSGFTDKKYHTIRAGKRFEAGDYFSPRVWSGKPYNSKQITIAPDTEIRYVWDFEITPDGIILLDGNTVGYHPCKRIEVVAKNDGLSRQDFEDWFMPDLKKFKGFKGQVICWSPDVKYHVY